MLILLKWKEQGRRGRTQITRDLSKPSIEEVDRNEISVDYMANANNTENESEQTWFVRIEPVMRMLCGGQDISFHLFNLQLIFQVLKDFRSPTDSAFSLL